MNLFKRINIYYKIEDLLEKYEGYRPYSVTLKCPFHDDNRKSAKIHHDTDGDRIHCFTEGRQFTVSDYLMSKGLNLKEFDPLLFDKDFNKKYKIEEKKEVLKENRIVKAEGVKTSEDFKKGKIDIKEFFTLLFKEMSENG
jgi:hypothetical protein